MQNYKNRVIMFKFKQKMPRKQRLGNNPYLCQQQTKQPQHISPSLLTHKAHRLNNSMYSTEDIFQHIDYEKQNKQLRQEIIALKQIINTNQSYVKQQLQQLTNKLKQKQAIITQLQEKIQKIQSQVNRKNQIFKEKLIQCQGIVKQLEEKETKSNAHHMLQTSRIQKLSFIDQVRPQSFVKITNQLVPQRTQPPNQVKEPSDLANYSSQVNTLRNLNESGQVRVYRNEENNRIMRNMDFSVENNRKHTPEIRFNLTPPKNRVSMGPVLVRPQSYIHLPPPKIANNQAPVVNNHINRPLIQERSSQPTTIPSSPTVTRRVITLTSPQQFTPVQRSQNISTLGNFNPFLQNNIRYIPQK